MDFIHLTGLPCLASVEEDVPSPAERLDVPGWQDAHERGLNPLRGEEEGAWGARDCVTGNVEEGDSDQGIK